MTHTLQEKRDFAREMRGRPTAAEAVLWQNLQRQRTGHRFERQVCIAGFILDFWCPRSRVAIELDGGIHRETAANDAEKERAMAARGIEVLRFANDELFKSLPVVLATIRHKCSERVLKGFASKKNLILVPNITSSSKCCGETAESHNEPMATGANDETPLCTTGRDVAEKLDTLIKSLAVSKRMDAQPVRFVNAKQEKRA